MPHKGGKKRGIPRKVYAQKARQQKRDSREDEWKPTVSAETRLSMIDVARNTETQRSWDEKGLRFSRVAFVSGSKINVDDNDDVKFEYPTKETEVIGLCPGYEKFSFSSSIQVDKETPRNTKFKTMYDEKTAVHANSRHCVSTGDEDQPKISKPSVTEAGNPPATDQTQSKQQDQRLQLNTSEQEESDSDADIILFTGRKTEEKLGSGNDISSLRGHTNQHNAKLNRLSGNIQLDDEDAAIEDYIANLFEQQSIDSTGNMASADELGQGSLFQDSGANSEANQQYNQSGESEIYCSDAIDSDNLPPDDSKLDRARAAMTDEEIAIRLAKQEELGLGSDDVILWHEQDMTTLVGDEQIDFEQLRRSALLYKENRKPQQREGFQFSNLYSKGFDALQGDDYGDFDIMDFERPSLQRGEPRHRRDLPFELSDSDLEKRMVEAWENDRSKKKERKKRREQLIEASLNNMSLEGSETRSAGMSLHCLKNEIDDFISSKNAHLSLMPMDRDSRKKVHEIAIMLGLQSKSKGKGLQRFPCLSKTSQSADLNSTKISSVFAKYNGTRQSNWLSTARKSYGKTVPIPGKQRKRDEPFSGLAYRDGDTVGGNAPALGSDNKGHALLSKMGWTSGTALGALNNKGSLEPIAQVIKASRAGLG